MNFVLLTIAGVPIVEAIGGAIVLLLAFVATVAALTVLQPYRYGADGVPFYVPFGIGLIPVCYLVVAAIDKSVLTVTLGSAGSGLLLGAVSFTLLARYRDTRPHGHLFEPVESWPVEEMNNALYDADKDGSAGVDDNEQNGEFDGGDDRAPTPPAIKEELIEDIDAKNIVDVRDDPVYGCRDDVHSFINRLYAALEGSRQRVSWEQKLNRVRSEYPDTATVDTTEAILGDNLITTLRNLRDTHQLNLSRRGNDVPYRLIELTIDHAEGNATADEVGDVFEEVLDLLYDRRKAIMEVRTCNRSLEEGHSEQSIAELLNEKSRVLRESSETGDARRVTSILLSKISGRIQNTTELQTELQQCKQARSTLESRLAKLDEQIDTDWVVSRIEQPVDDRPGGVVEAGIERGVIGERVGTEAAKRVRSDGGVRYNRGSLARSLIDDLTAPVTEQTASVADTIEEAAETVHEHSFVEPHFSPERTRTDIEDQGDDAIKAARRLDVPGLERAVRSHVKSELRNLRTVSEEDFVSRHIAYQQLETLTDVLTQVETEQNDTQDDAPREQDLEEKKQQAQRLMEETGGSGIAIAEHYLNLVSELQNRAAGATNEERREALLEAGEHLLDYIIKMYQNPDLQDALAWME